MIKRTLLALVWGGVTFYYTPSLFFWLLPVFTGMLLGAPVIRLTSSLSFGRFCRRIGIFVIKEELHEQHVLKQVRASLKFFGTERMETFAAITPALPQDTYAEMKVQELHKAPLSKRLVVKNGHEDRPEQAMVK